jgi:ABC-type dipeptide/oligopeptide/nickel transport system permease subunit
VIPRWVGLAMAGACLALLALGVLLAPEKLSEGEPARAWEGLLAMPPFGADDRGRPLLEVALQGARVVAVPSVVAGLLVTLLGVFGGLVRCAGSERVEAVVDAIRELVGALPRMVVILVVALIMPLDWRGLGALAVVWALLAAPGAMDEAAAVAGRLGGARFVEALRAHGFSRARIYLLHVVGLNLRPVVVRQGAETLMQVVFLEIAMSYLALDALQPSFTHSDATRSWADLLYMGYSSLVLDVPSLHALLLGLALVGVTALVSVSLSSAARAR